MKNDRMENNIKIIARGNFVESISILYLVLIIIKIIIFSGIGQQLILC